MRTEKVIHENNKLIALFMDFEMTVEDHYGIIIIQSPEGDSYDLSQLKYADSWDWLMPVYRKIRDIINDRSKFDKHTRTKGDLLDLDIQMAICEVNIQKAFNYIVQFVKWHNKNEKI